MSVVQLLAKGAEVQHRELPVHPEVFGLIALGVLFGLLALTWAFRGVAAKHAHLADQHHDAAHGGAHGAGHGGGH